MNDLKIKIPKELIFDLSVCLKKNAIKSDFDDFISYIESNGNYISLSFLCKFSALIAHNNDSLYKSIRNVLTENLEMQDTDIIRIFEKTTETN